MNKFRCTCVPNLSMYNAWIQGVQREGDFMNKTIVFYTCNPQMYIMKIIFSWWYWKTNLRANEQFIDLLSSVKWVSGQ